MIYDFATTIYIFRKLFKVNSDEDDLVSPFSKCVYPCKSYCLHLILTKLPENVCWLNTMTTFDEQPNHCRHCGAWPLNDLKLTISAGPTPFLQRNYSNWLF